MRPAYGRLVPIFTKILVATDFSDDSNHALAFAEELARRFSAEMLLMHVDQPLAPVMVSELSPGLDIGAMSRIAEEQRLLALRELDMLTARLRDSGLKARGLLKVGAPFLEIVHAAYVEGADLIVLGTHGRTGLAHVLLGSVAERVVRKAHCPVLTIRHPDRTFKHPLEGAEKPKADKAEKAEKREAAASAAASAAAAATAGASGAGVAPTASAASSTRAESDRPDPAKSPKTA
jgi:nucleotide-binding universal stress UspA family protein